MADPSNGDRPGMRSSLRPERRAEALAQLLEHPLGDEGKVLDALVSGLATGEATPALFTRLHEAAVAQERVANLSFAYERVARDARIKMLPKPRQADFFLSAARFFADVFGDVEAAVGFAERALALSPADPVVFDLLETLLASSQDGGKLAKLYSDGAARVNEPAEKLRLLRAAVELAEAFGGAPDQVAVLKRQIVELDPEDQASREGLERLYVANRKFKELAELLERALLNEPRPGALDDIRQRLIGLYRGELRDPSRGAPHVELLLSRDPIDPAALQAAEALVDTRAAAPRIAPLLSDAYHRLGRVEDEASTLALELKVSRPPRLLEVHRRLAELRQDVLGDPAGALELLEPLVSRDPGDDALRARYLAVSATFHRQVEAAKLLGRAIASSKDAGVKARVGLEIATIHAGEGDLRRARSVLDPLLDEAPDDATRLTLARRISDLHPDGSDPKGLSRCLAALVRLESELAVRVAAARRLVDLEDTGALEPKLAIVGWRALVQSPRVDDALTRLQALYDATGDDEGRVELLGLRAARAKDPEEARALAFQAAEIRASRAGDRSLAIAAFRELVDAHGPSREALTRLASLLEQQRDFRGLASVLEELLGISPPEEQAPVLGRLARVRLVELKDPRGALGALGNALMLDPREATGRRLAERLLVEGTERLAAADLLEPIYRAEKSPAALVRLLEVRGELGEGPAVRLAALDEAYSLLEGSASDARRSLSIAGAVLALSLRHGPADLSRAAGRFRSAAARAGDPARRAALLGDAVAGLPIRDAEMARLAIDAAEALTEVGEIQRAIETYRSVLGFAPASQEVLPKVDALLAEQGSPEERLVLYRAALERDESAARRPELLRTIARIQHKDVGDLLAAAETLERLVAECPGDLSAHDAFVEVLTAAGNGEAVQKELLRALSLMDGERRARTQLSLAREFVRAGDRDRAAALLRTLVTGDALSLDALPDAEAIAEACGDRDLRLLLLERRAERALDEAEQARCLEKLGLARSDDRGDTAGAVEAFLRGARIARELSSEGALARRLFERVLDADPDHQEAARHLVEAYAAAGEFAAVPGAFAVLLRGDSPTEATALLVSLEQRALAAGAAPELVAALDEALAGPANDSGRRARALLGTKARVLALSGDRRGAAAVFRSLVEGYGEAEDVRAFQAFLADPADVAEVVDDLRWLFSHRAEKLADPLPVLFEWAEVEAERLRDPRRAAVVLERVLRLAPGHAAARAAFRVAMVEAGEAPHALAVLQGLLAQVPPEEAAEIRLEVAALLVEHLGRPEEALPILREALSEQPPAPEAVRIAHAALRQTRGSPEIALLMGNVALSWDGARAIEGLQEILVATLGAEEMRSVRVAWHLRLVELLAGEPGSGQGRALGAAIGAAVELGSEMSLWEAAERLARREGDPAAVAEAYRRTLEGQLDEAAGEAVGRRYVEFQEEWFDDPEAVLSLLERVLQLSPRARWALDRIKLAYNAEGRWDDLFSLYDRALAGAVTPEEERELLDEAAVAAKDLANDAGRAISYLERLLALSPEPRTETLLERLYERTGSTRKLLALLLGREGSVPETEAARLQARLAKLHLDLGEAEHAFVHIERVLISDPADPNLNTLLERLSSLPAPAALAPEAAEPKARGANAKKKKKASKVEPPRDPRQEAVHLLEARHRSAGDAAGLARALEAAVRVETERADHLRRLEELVRIHRGALADPERAFEFAGRLVQLDPASPAYRAELGALGEQLGAGSRRAALLLDLATEVADRELRVSLLREAALVREATGDGSGAADVLLQVLSLSLSLGRDVVLDVARKVDGLLSSLGRHEERARVLSILSEVEPEVAGRRAAYSTLARVARTELGDPERARVALGACLELEPSALETIADLEAVLEETGRWEELVVLLHHRAALPGAADARADHLRAAHLVVDRLSDVARGIEAFRALRARYGADDESYQALHRLLVQDERFGELGQLLEEAASVAEEPRKRALFTELGDVRRDRTGEPVRAVEAYVAARDFGRAVTAVQHVDDRDTRRSVAERLLELATGPWQHATPEEEPAIADAAHFAVSLLVRVALDEGNAEAALSTQLRGAALPFSSMRKRTFLRDAAFSACDRIEDPARAIELLQRLFSENPADEIASASVTRFARLLEESARHAELAGLWEGQAEVRRAAGDRVGAAALFARAGEVHEVRIGNVPAAVATHRLGAALGGEASLEALARIHIREKSFRSAAASLEWLCAQSTREDLAERALLLADTYLALGEWEPARARLEHAAATAQGAEPVRKRLAELYRQHGDWEPLARLVVDEASRAADDRVRLALYREAASLHFRERGDAAAAVPLLERALEIEPEDAPLRLELSEVLGAAGRYDEARAVLRAQIERYGQRRPKDRAIVHLCLARVALAAGDRAEALGELDIGAKINPAHPGMLRELARLSLEEGQLARAERTYRALLLVLRKPDPGLGAAPARAEIYLELSEVAARQGDPERATELVESAFEAALDTEEDSVALERALSRAERYELLARAVEARLSTAPDPARAARALSDLVALHAAHLGGRSTAVRVQEEAGRIHRDLEQAARVDPAAWAAMSQIYEWLGEPALEATALERRVASFTDGADREAIEPLLRLARMRLADPEHCDEGVTLATRALDLGAGPERVWELLSSEKLDLHVPTLRLRERLAREPGRESSLVRVVALRAAQEALPVAAVHEALVLAAEQGDSSSPVAILRGALQHADGGYAPGDRAWLRETLARILERDGDIQEARVLLEAAAGLAPPPYDRTLMLEAARLAVSDADRDTAARLYRSALAREPSDRDAWEPLLGLYRESGDRERLLALISATAPLVDAPGDRSRLRYEEATLMLAQPERTEEALHLLRDIVRDDPTLDGATMLLAELLEKQGNLGELISLVEEQLAGARAAARGDLERNLVAKLTGLLERSGDAGRAIVTVRTWLSLEPGNRDALLALVRLEEQGAGDAESLASALEQLLGASTGEEVSLLAARLVELRTEAGDGNGVERALRIACAANPMEPALREKLVTRYLERGDWAAAGEALEQAAERQGGDPGLLLRAVEAYEHARDLERAILTIGRLVEKSSEPDLHLERARLLSELGRTGDALADIEAAHALSSSHTSELVMALRAAIARADGEDDLARHTLRLAALLEEMGETGAARDELGRLLKVQPKHRDALRRMAALASAEARWEEAAQTYRRLIPLEEGADRVAAAMNLADACEHSGNLVDARAGLERALEGAKDGAALRERLRHLYEVTGAHRELAVLLRGDAKSEPNIARRVELLLRAAELLLEHDGDLTEAVAVLEETQRLSPESISGVVLLARAHAMRGMPEEALSSLEAVIAAHRGRRTKELSAVYHEVSNVHLEGGNLTAALDALARAFDLDMRNGDLAMQLGHLALDVDDADAAQRAFRSVTMMRLRQPGGTEGASADAKAVAYYHLSRIAQAEGDVRKARLMASKAVSENPNHAEAQELLKELRAT